MRFRRPPQRAGAGARRCPGCHARAWLRCALLLLGLAGAACSSPAPVVSFAPPEKPLASEDYEAVLQRWTREDRVISSKTLDTTLRVHGTLFSPEFQAALAARKSTLFHLSAAEQSRLKDEQRERWETSFSFFVAAATADAKWNDFHRQQSSWRLSLANDQGHQVRPEAITGERELTPTLKELYPYLGSFYYAYRVRFPRTLEDGSPLVTAQTRTLTLLFSGPLGQAQLTWRLQ